MLTRCGDPISSDLTRFAVVWSGSHNEMSSETKLISLCCLRITCLLTRIVGLWKEQWQSPIRDAKNVHKGRNVGLTQIAPAPLNSSCTMSKFDTFLKNLITRTANGQRCKWDARFRLTNLAVNMKLRIKGRGAGRRTLTATIYTSLKWELYSSMVFIIVCCGKELFPFFLLTCVRVEIFWHNWALQPRNFECYPKVHSGTYKEEMETLTLSWILLKILS